MKVVQNIMNLDYAVESKKVIFKTMAENANDSEEESDKTMKMTRSILGPKNVQTILLEESLAEGVMLEGLKHSSILKS